MIRATPRTVTMTAGDDELRAALESANLPTLLLVLERFTGDPRWLADPYRPSRTKGLDDNDDGGFPPEVRDRIREAAFTVLTEWRDGRRALPEPPPDSAITGLLSVSLGETVPPEYGPGMAAEAGFHPRPEVRWTAGRPAAADRMHVLVVGAGPSGVATAATLRELGIPHTVVERGGDVGGVWAQNDYPGAGVDTPTHLYSYSFLPRPGWTRYYAKQPEILGYFRHAADELGIRPTVRFHTTVTDAEWDEASARWDVTLRGPDGTTDRMRVTAVISCVGVLTEPSVPDLPGADTFAGPLFHSSRWDHALDLTGRRVAVIGTGATSQQIVPAIAGAAGRVLVFQRTPQWVAPNPNYRREVPEGARLLLEQVPYYGAFYRIRLVWQFQDKLLATLHRDPGWEHPERSVNAANDRHRAFFTRHLEAELGDRTDLRDKVLPDYPPYGKRILMDNGWFRTLLRDDVELVTDAVTGFDAHHVHTADGGRHEADVVVLATGFRTSAMLASMRVRGRSGATLRDHWGDDDARAHLGTTVPDFPNLFLVGGPNTFLGHGGSTIHVTECSVAYIAQLLVRMVEDGIAALEVREDVTAAYNAEIDAAHEGLVWTHPGTTNWFRNRAGRVVALSPFRGVDFWARTRTPDLADFHLTPAEPDPAAG